MSNYPQSLLACPIAQDGDRLAIPENAIDAGTGRISQREGWKKINSSPLGEGGIPPKREDFNAVLFLLSQLLFWYQQGGQMRYSSELDYEPENEVFHLGSKYRCLVANGPSSKTVSPGSDKTVWKNLDAPSVIAGQITPFYNCRLGGSDGRRLIPWGESAADERYVICDGGSDGLSGNVPNLIGKFVMPSTVDDSGKTGGSNTATTTSSLISGTVGETVLTLDQIPSHSHGGSCQSAGNHAHNRGTMNITGKFGGGGQGRNTVVEGAFYDTGGNQNVADSGNTSAKVVGFDASRNWTGSTSTAGNHTHTVAIESAGGSRGHTHTLSGESHSHSVTVPLPPFFKMAYFVKLPE